MTRRAKDLRVGDVLTDFGSVTAVAVHKPGKRPAVSTVGMKKRSRVIGPPVQFTVAVVEIRAENAAHPIYKWPNERIELAA